MQTSIPFQKRYFQKSRSACYPLARGPTNSPRVSSSGPFLFLLPKNFEKISKTQSRMDQTSPYLLLDFRLILNPETLSQESPHDRHAPSPDQPRLRNPPPFARGARLHPPHC